MCLCVRVLGNKASWLINFRLWSLSSSPDSTTELAIKPWANDFPLSVSLSFCKMGIIISAL